MNQRALIRFLPDGRRLHLHDGPIDLIVAAFGAPQEVSTAYSAASARFVTVLDELCSELALLRQPCSEESPWPRDAVAQRMMAAVKPYAPEYFITPMAAVAGAVAEEILAAMVSTADVSRAYVNNGGDIALHLSGGEQFVVGMVERPDRPSLMGTTRLQASDPIRGIATSGWRGRSFSLGIADTVTVLADRAAAADAAATIIADAVNLPEHPAIVRIAARELQPDSDLGERLVTQAVGELRAHEVDQALTSGVHTADRLLRIGLIRSATLSLQGEARIVGSTRAPLKFTTPSAERILANA
jgi:ApbE superfamily uncharacterized protein (UPF0280 family)